MLARLERIAGLSMLILAIGTASARAGSAAFKTYGDVMQVGLPLGAGAIALAGGDREGAWQLLESWGATMATTYALKNSIHARRPNGGLHSFPSGHSSAAFAAASFMGNRYGWISALPWEIAAAGVAGSRIDARAHHWRDVIASAAIAHGFSYLLVDRMPKRIQVGLWMDAPRSAAGLSGRVNF